MAKTVGIIGTGTFARALAKRLFYSGYDVLIGSRNPQSRRLPFSNECSCDLMIMPIQECLKSTEIIFIATHVENYRSLTQCKEELFRGKIVVDVSNRNKPSAKNSNAEYLSNLLPGANVVKAFNIISAYAMENDYDSSCRRVFVAGDCAKSRGTVSDIARDMGYTPVDFGCLKSSRRIEAYPLRLLPGWRGPLGFAVGVFNVWLLYAIYIYFMEKSAYHWDQIFVKVLNKPLCMTSITVLATTYLASSVAACFQIYHGSKYIAFPKWLDKWLKTRKQLGLVAFILVTVHVIMSVLLMSPTYYRSWYRKQEVEIPVNLTSLNETTKIPVVTWMIWKGEAACLTGILAFLTLCFVAISTIPSVAESLNWREWRFIQSRLGHVALFLAVLHVVIMGAPGWANKPGSIYKSITFLSSLIPWITLTLKIILTFPCIDKYVQKIRKGWERNPKHCHGTCAETREVHGYKVLHVENNKPGCGCSERDYQLEVLTPNCQDCTMV